MKALFAFIVCLAVVNAAYVPHEVELDLNQNDVANELATLIEAHTNELDLILPKYISLPISNVSQLVGVDIDAVHNKYLTEDFTSYAPIDGYFITSRNAMTRWYVARLAAGRLRYQSHIYGPYTFKIVQVNPRVIEVNTTQSVSGFSENPVFSPVLAVPGNPKQDQLLSTIFSTHLIYQFTKTEDGWKMSHKNEDFSKVHYTCQHDCTFLGPWCPPSGGCMKVQANWNRVLNPLYPPPPFPQYIALNNPPIVFN